MAVRPGARLRFSTPSGSNRGGYEKGVPANFFVYYEIDDDESKHALSLDEYGQKETTSAWVLLRADT